MRVLIAALLCIAAPSLARAADEVTTSTDATFRRGNEAYLHGKHKEAVDAYEQVAALGVRSEDLFYNLGNAYVKLGQLGPAIYNYERALLLDPGLEDVQFNLNATREAAKKRGEDRLIGEDATPRWIRVVQPYTVSLLSWLFLGAWVALFVVLGALHIVQPGFLRVGLQATLAFVAIGTVVAGGFLGARLYLRDRVEQAIVLPDSVQVKEGPDASYTSSFPVHGGLKVRITEKEQDWVRVRLANGLEGWLRERELGRL